MKKLMLMVLTLLSLIAFGCRETYTPKPIAAGHGFYDEELFSFFTVSTVFEPKEEEIILKYAITAQMHIVTGTQRKLNVFQADWITLDDTYDSYYRFEKDDETDSRFAGQEFLPPMPMSGGGLKSISALYQYVRTVDNRFEEKTVSYYEPMLTYDAGEFSSPSLLPEGIPDFGVQYLDTDEQNYRFKFYIDFEDSLSPSHIDLQSFIQTAEGTVYPLWGLYHYAGIAKDYLSVSDEKVTREVPITAVFLKLLYYTNGTTDPEAYFYQLPIPQQSFSAL